MTDSDQDADLDIRKRAPLGCVVLAWWVPGGAAIGCVIGIALDIAVGTVFGFRAGCSDLGVAFGALAGVALWRVWANRQRPS
jgi:hypothetical protein